MRFQDLKHFKSICGYEVNGSWYPRVTQILSIKSKPGLDYFFKEMENYSSAEAVKQKSAEEGSLVHATIESVVKDEKTPVPETIRPSIAAFEKLRRERGIIFVPEFMERLVWSGRHRYAGTIDALGMVDGKFGVIDVKTSTGFYPEYNLQTAAYVSALQEIETKKAVDLPRDIETRWILRVDQKKLCQKCGATLREKGGRKKIRAPYGNGSSRLCAEPDHRWGELKGEAEIKEFPNIYKDIKAFIAAKTLWEWEHEYWLKQAGYLG